MRCLAFCPCRYTLSRLYGLSYFVFPITTSRYISRKVHYIMMTWSQRNASPKQQAQSGPVEPSMHRSSFHVPVIPYDRRLCKLDSIFMEIKLIFRVFFRTSAYFFPENLSHVDYCSNLIVDDRASPRDFGKYVPSSYWMMCSLLPTKYLPSILIEYLASSCPMFDNVAKNPFFGAAICFSACNEIRKLK